MKTNPQLVPHSPKLTLTPLNRIIRIAFTRTAQFHPQPCKRLPGWWLRQATARRSDHLRRPYQTFTHMHESFDNTSVYTINQSPRMKMTSKPRNCELKTRFVPPEHSRQNAPDSNALPAPLWPISVFCFLLSDLCPLPSDL